MAKRRRLRGKQTVARVVAVAAQTVAYTWQIGFLAQEVLEPEALGDWRCRKQVYLVTMAHPKNLLAGQGGLRSPDDLTHADIEKVILDVFDNPCTRTRATGRGCRAVGRQFVRSPW